PKGSLTIYWHHSETPTEDIPRHRKAGFRARTLRMSAFGPKRTSARRLYAYRAKSHVHFTSKGGHRWCRRRTQKRRSLRQNCTGCREGFSGVLKAGCRPHTRKPPRPEGPIARRGGETKIRRMSLGIDTQQG